MEKTQAAEIHWSRLRRVIFKPLLVISKHSPTHFNAALTPKWVAPSGLILCDVVLRELLGSNFLGNLK